MKNRDLPIKSALISVSDKTNITAFAQQLHTLNIRILSTGGTANQLEKHGIPVTHVSDYTGFPEMLDGRVKTLHPKIHAGLLARSTIDDATLTSHKIDHIDLVVVNLYPFEQTVAMSNCTLATAIENIDIGGPTLLRAAAKNHDRVTVIVNPHDYTMVLHEIKQHQGCTTYNTRFSLAQKAFAHTAKYDATITHYLTNRLQADKDLDSAVNSNVHDQARQHSQHSKKPMSKGHTFPDTYHIQLTKQQDLRYGENPHQLAAFYKIEPTPTGSIASAKQLHGKPLSFNNIADADAALACAQQFEDRPTCVIVKHANPCGVATSDTTIAAYQHAFSTDPTSSFGGIIAFNQQVGADTINAIINNQFVEVIIAPEFTENAVAALQGKPNVRLLSTGYPPNKNKHAEQNANPSTTIMHTYKSVQNGMLIQEYDCQTVNQATLRTVTQHSATPDTRDDLLFAWRIAKHTKSNAIIIAKKRMTIGIGAGQMSRIDSTKIALRKANEAGLSTENTVLASDAFFPFPDNVKLAAQAGVTAIIQPGGSIRDKEIIATANELGITMIFTGIRHFLH